MRSRIQRGLASLRRRSPARGTVAASTTAPAPGRPSPWLELSEDSLDRLPPGGAELRVLVRDPGVVRALTRTAGPAYGRVVLALTSWRAPTPGWRGALGPLPALVGVKVTWPASEKGRLTVVLDLGEPIPVGTVARAILPLLTPVRALPAHGSPAYALDAPGDERALSLLPDPAARQLVREPDPDVLRGADVLIVESDGPATEVPLEVRTAGLGPAPLIDLHVHRPLGRRRPEPGVPPTSATLVPVGDGWRVLGADGAALVDLPLGQPLRESQVRRLRPVDAIGLDGLAAAADPRAVERLAEIAAVGPVLHGGGHLALGALDAGLVTLLSGRLPADALSTTLRSVAQVRRAIRAHSGIAVRDALARQHGWSSALPTVTVLLTSRRTEAALRTLQSLGAQTYPHLDVVLAMHGAPTPDLGALDGPARALVSRVIEAGPAELFGHVLADATAAAGGVLVTKMDDDDAYGPEHVWDLVQAYLWSGAQVVGKQPEYVYLEGRGETLHRTFRTEAYVRQVAGGTIMVSAADLMAVGGWRPVPRSVDRALLLRVLQAGGLVYATRGPGFVYTRHDRGHTWVGGDEEFLTRVLERWDGLPDRLANG